jgi:hypothetical protein
MPVNNLVAMEKDEREKHEEFWGRFNDAPPGWREVTEQEMGPRLFRFCVVKHEFRQVRPPEPPSAEPSWAYKPYVQAYLHFWPDGTGYAVSWDSQAAKVRWYMFGCDHAYRELSQAECCKRGIYHAGYSYHVTKCSKCGDIGGYDSGD